LREKRRQLREGIKVVDKEREKVGLFGEARSKEVLRRVEGELKSLVKVRNDMLRRGSE